MTDITMYWILCTIKVTIKVKFICTNLKDIHVCVCGLASINVIFKKKGRSERPNAHYTR